jgi:hypothetical protein
LIKIRSNYEENKDFVDEKLAEVLSVILYKKLQGREKEMDKLIEILQDDSINITL